MNVPVIVGAVRTPIGRHGGALARMRPDDLAAAAIAGLVERTGVDPARIARAAEPRASSPEPHKRLRVPPGTGTGSSASSAAIRATFRLSSPAWFAQPSSTSSRADQSTAGSRSTRDRSTCAARSSGRTAASAPPYRPMGVRTPSTRYAVLTRVLLCARL